MGTIRELIFERVMEGEFTEHLASNIAPIVVEHIESMLEDNADGIVRQIVEIEYRDVHSFKSGGYKLIDDIVSHIVDNIVVDVKV